MHSMADADACAAATAAAQEATLWTAIQSCSGATQRGTGVTFARGPLAARAPDDPSAPGGVVIALCVATLL